MYSNWCIIIMKLVKLFKITKQMVIKSINYFYLKYTIFCCQLNFRIILKDSE
jgi:hypothetical protein